MQVFYRDSMVFWQCSSARVSGPQDLKERKSEKGKGQ